MNTYSLAAPLGRRSTMCRRTLEDSRLEVLHPGCLRQSYLVGSAAICQVPRTHELALPPIVTILLVEPEQAGFLFSVVMPRSPLSPHFDRNNLSRFCFHFREKRSRLKNAEIDDEMIT